MFTVREKREDVGLVLARLWQEETTETRFFFFLFVSSTLDEATRIDEKMTPTIFERYLRRERQRQFQAVSVQMRKPETWKMAR